MRVAVGVAVFFIFLLVFQMCSKDVVAETFPAYEPPMVEPVVPLKVDNFPVEAIPMDPVDVRERERKNERALLDLEEEAQDGNSSS